MHRRAKVVVLLLWTSIANVVIAEKFLPGFNSLNDFAPSGVTNLPDFVGFSYSRADTRNAPSSRFVSFLKENTNVNANVLQRYGSFEATRSGVYAFSFGFLSEKGEAAIVVLRKNGETVVSALSEEDGYNPVYQSTLLYLRPRDVVQLEIVQGRVYETNSPEFSYTTFSGWLIGPVINQGGSGFTPSPRPPPPIGPPAPPPNSREELPCCCKICLPQNMNPPIYPTGKPPYAPPSYAPPIFSPSPPPSRRPPTDYGPPRTPPTARPPYIVTTTSPKPNYYPPSKTTDILTPPDRPPSGRKDDNAEDLNCCDSLLISTSASRSRALEVQDEKFGVYRLQYVDRSPLGRGRATFKHIDRDLFLFFITNDDVTGWIVGPDPGVAIGGLFMRSNSLCVEHTQDSSGESWQYYDDTLFLRDPTMTVSCFADGYLDGRGNTNGYSTVINGKTHYHRHEHFHYNNEPRSIDFHEPIPSYKVRGNNKFVEATFLFPNNSSIPVRPNRKPSYHNDHGYPSSGSSGVEIIEARHDPGEEDNDGQTETNKDGFVIHKNKES